MLARFGQLARERSWLVTQVEAGNSIAARLEIAADDLALDPSVALQIYRIVQEAIANVIRHSGAQAMTVSIVRQGDALCVSVSDDGIGIARNRRKRGALGVGMGTMKSRAALIGGELSVRTPAVGGTSVELKLDLSGVVAS